MRQKSKLTNNANLKDIIRNLKIAVFDFDGVFTDNRVLVNQNGQEAVFCWRGDGLGLTTLKSLGIKILVLTTEPNLVVTARCKKLKITCIQNCKDKAKTLKEKIAKLNIPLKSVAYLGNDINDLGCLKIVGFPACVRDSHSSIFPNCLYITKAKGGYGAVREFCDYIVQIKNTYGKKTF